MNKRRFDRTARIGDLIQKELAVILLHDMADSRFPLVTVMSVTVSKDLAYAKVYVSLLMDDEGKINDTIKALNRAAKGLRFSLAKAVKLRVIPELRFVFDETTAHGFHISNLIDSAINKEKK